VWPGEPPAPPHDLVLHHRDLGGGAAEADDTELEEEARDLAEAAGGRLVDSRQSILGTEAR